jgi:iron complex outermembrane receptor protein
VRVASAPSAIVKLSDAASLRYQGGIFLFTQNYDQDAVNNFAPGLLSPLLPLPVSQHSPQAALDDFGFGLYGQGIVTLNEKVDVTGGARVDYENKKALLNTFYTPQIAPSIAIDAEKSFSNVSPQASVAYHLQRDVMTYASIGGGFKAGGFNPASPAGSEAYDEEHTWHVEGGVKSAFNGGRVTTNVAVFHIDWNDLQLNLPNPQVPGQFYIANVGKAASSGFEVELNARPHAAVDVFAAFGYTHARFGQGSVSSGVNVSDKKLPNTPDYTATIGTQLSHALAPVTIYGRAEVVFYGAFQYDDANTTGQEAYSLANFRGGVRGKYLFGEAWIRNAFDTNYIPVAFAYPNFAPSGFAGESGRPRTFGVNLGVTF